MMMTKLTPSHEIKKHLKVLDFWFNPTGLELLINYRGEEIYKEFTPWQTASLLHRADLISEYRSNGRGPTNGRAGIDICFFETASADSDIEFPVVLEYEDYVRNTRFSQYDALCIAVLVVWDAELNEVEHSIKACL